MSADLNIPTMGIKMPNMGTKATTRAPKVQKQINDAKEFAGLKRSLRRLGYRAENRYIVFQVVPRTLGLGPEVWRVLAKCHEVRNLGEYEGNINVDERLLADLIKACKAVASALDKLPSPA